MARKKKPKLPLVGAAFAFPLEDGRFSVCRVLWDTTSEPSQKHGGAVLVAGSTWIGEHVPPADEPALRPILTLNHHGWVNTLTLVWILEELPPELIPIGTIDPTLEDLAIPCETWGGWSFILMQPLAQWRWDHDREAVLAEWRIEERQIQADRQKAFRERAEALKRRTLEELRKHRFFANWKGLPPAKVVRASRKVMLDTVEALIALGPDASEPERLAVLQRCIESFNALDANMQFIDTVEREDICEEFEAIVHACGLGDRQDLADEWRDW